MTDDSFHMECGATIHGSGFFIEHMEDEWTEFNGVEWVKHTAQRPILYWKSVPIGGDPLDYQIFRYDLSSEKVAQLQEIKETSSPTDEGRTARVLDLLFLWDRERENSDDDLLDVLEDY